MPPQLPLWRLFSKSELCICSALTALLFQGSAIAQTEESSEYKRPNIAVSDPYLKSKILISKRYHTLVPKRAVLYVPDALKGKVLESQPEVKFKVWPSFYRQNQGWIYAFHVNLDEAKGVKPISEDRMEQLKKLGKVIVAVYRHNPISVLEPKNDIAKEMNPSK